ncbi:MAG: hypothetical protein QM622_09185 [Microbacterium sp.]
MSAAPRRPSAAVYRRRRLVALLLVLAVIAAVVVAFWQPWRGVLAQPTASVTPSFASPLPTSPTPVDTATPSATPTPTPTPTASSTETSLAACSTSSITVLAVTDQDSYGSGELPELSITLSNTSDTACLINVGTATQKFTITSGSDTWWRSTDCQSESSDQVVQLAAGQTVSSVTPLVWDRTRSSTTTCDDSRSNAPAGYYNLSVSIGGIEAADTKAFQLR